ncbi:MAG: hypothetical protein ACK56F_28795 [bacterium]
MAISLPYPSQEEGVSYLFNLFLPAVAALRERRRGVSTLRVIETGGRRKRVNIYIIFEAGKSSVPPSMTEDG